MMLKEKMYMILGVGKGRLAIYKHPVRKWFLLGYGLCATIFIGGAWLQLSGASESALPRAGALIVVLGIFLAWTDIRGVFKREEEAVKDHLDSSGSGVPYRPSFHEQRDRLFLRMEVFCLGFGTFTWGFGDLRPSIFISLLFLTSVSMWSVKFVMERRG